jgi:hypothetical protein
MAVIVAGIFVASVGVAAAAGNYPYDPFGCRSKIRTGHRALDRQ